MILQKRIEYLPGVIEYYFAEIISLRKNLSKINTKKTIVWLQYQFITIVKTHFSLITDQFLQFIKYKLSKSIIK
jgi:hypothetical protein